MRMNGFYSEFTDGNLVEHDAVCMGCDQPFQLWQPLVARVMSLEPDRPADLAATAAELLCEACFVSGEEG